ncbi:MAG: enoyl-CoA hydratase-related protein [Chloroflexota bacterium]|nr:MAG: enoyl-CoA hydratase [Chloroflexota bacterium]
MAYEQIRFETDGPVATITIARERVLNALNRATVAEIHRALQAVEEDETLRAAVLTGAGDRAFAAGADIGELQALPSADEARRFCERTHEVGLFIGRMRKPVIAAINGYALGGGLELAMCCDIRIAADTARLGQPEINLGLIPGWGGTQRLPRLIGPAAARLLCLSGEPIDAHEALRLGLVERVVPAAELAEAAATLARKLAEKAPLALAAIKQAINRGLDMPLAEGCMYEAALFGALAVTEDAKEGTAAFLEKRRATWSGR